MEQNISAKDLTKEPPRSPYVRINGFALLGRSIDKCRAFLSGTVGDYSFNCGLDKRLFKFKNILAEDYKAFVATGASDEEIGKWVKDHGDPKTDEEIKEWSDSWNGTFDNIVEEDRDSFGSSSNVCPIE